LGAIEALGAELDLVEENGAISGTITGWGERGPAMTPCNASMASSKQAVAEILRLDCGNSGTTARLLMGVLAGWEGRVLLEGDKSLSARPMARVSGPLSQMGASIAAPELRCMACGIGMDTLPQIVRGHYPLKAITHRSRVASAQVKSAILLAGLRTSGATTVIEPALSRDHTELLLPAYGVQVARSAEPGAFSASVCGGQRLVATDMQVPGDPSSAAFMLVAAALVPGSEVTVRGVLLNPTRTGFLDVMRRMGADVAVRERDSWQLGAERVGDVTVCYCGQLGGVDVAQDDIPSLIDEVPILALLATAGSTRSVFHGVGELRVKESDRLAAIVDGLTSLGCRAFSEGDDLIVEPGQPKAGAARFTSPAAPPVLGDHRLAMTWAVASEAFGLGLALDGRDAVAVSYPSFFSDLDKLKFPATGESRANDQQLPQERQVAKR
jgi:3-phosphoshikimate 1-carboxyvinyltransferase